jgi:hypothetical protein
MKFQLLFGEQLAPLRYFETLVFSKKKNAEKIATIEFIGDIICQQTPLPEYKPTKWYLRWLLGS